MSTSKPLHIHSPLLYSTPLSKLIQRNVYLKIDSVQPSGSFKIRGIGHLCQLAAQNGTSRFVASSGGNAGLATSYAARMLGIAATIVVPTTTSQLSIQRLKDDGAQVIVHGANWNEADARAREELAQYPEGEATYVPPFDDPLVWKGHESIVEEIVADWPLGSTKPGAVLLCVGGGGLYVGVVEGLHRMGWGDVPVLVAETEGAASFYQAWTTKTHVTLPEIRTIATTLGARRVAARAFEWMHQHPTTACTVSDAQAVKACYAFLNDHRILAEPSCGATLAMVYEKTSIDLSAYDNIVVIVCGGSGVNTTMLDKWMTDFGISK